MVRRGHDVDHTGRDVGPFGHEPADEGGVPRRVGRGLEHHRIAGRECLAQLGERDLEREVPRGDGPHHPGRLLDDHAGVGAAAEVGRVGQGGLPLELVDEPDRIAQGLGEGRIELRSEGEHPRAPDLEDELFTELLALGLEGLLELFEAALAEGPVGGPVGLVEGPPRSRNGPLHVSHGPVGNVADDLLGRRVDVVEPLPRRRLDELAVDEHVGFRIECRAAVHGAPWAGIRCRPAADMTLVVQKNTVPETSRNTVTTAGGERW